MVRRNFSAKMSATAPALHSSLESELSSSGVSDRGTGSGHMSVNLIDEDNKTSAERCRITGGLVINEALLDTYRSMKRKLFMDLENVAREEGEVRRRTKDVHARWELAKAEKEEKLRKFERLRAQVANLEVRLHGATNNLREMNEKLEQMEKDIENWKD
ncbi:hypothetical protein Hypma_014047 [Hypsizygus marmoreus]|uniref:Uncharacterized protein n=1 Tax=Hypsizygus marmoreus TaxID=39966 RepID=A0A151VE21_HYPMA|nr:hypothetical protein Hypma_014063 [Hypsizygus marmoreus]RDB29890.1 hypothetical protein Hypma_014047 [Hypsizygus marmoreus]